MPRFRTQFPTFYRFAALLALWAMLTPALTMLVHHPKADVMPTTMSDCGMDMGKDSAPPKDKNPSQKLPSCPICMGLHLLGGGFVPSEAVVFSLPALPVITYAAAWMVFFVALSVAPQARPRAPPSRA